MVTKEPLSSSCSELTLPHGLQQHLISISILATDMPRHNAAAFAALLTHFNLVSLHFTSSSLDRDRLELKNEAMCG